MDTREMGFDTGDRRQKTLGFLKSLMHFFTAEGLTTVGLLRKYLNEQRDSFNHRLSQCHELAEWGMSGGAWPDDPKANKYFVDAQRGFVRNFGFYIDETNERLRLLGSYGDEENLTEIVQNLEEKIKS